MISVGHSVLSTETFKRAASALFTASLLICTFSMLPILILHNTAKYAFYMLQSPIGFPGTANWHPQNTLERLSHLKQMTHVFIVTSINPTQILRNDSLIKYTTTQHETLYSENPTGPSQSHLCHLFQFRLYRDKHHR